MPATDNQAVEFPQGVVVEVLADLALDLKADIVFVMVEFSCQRCYGDIVVIFELGFESENIPYIVLGVGPTINSQKPFVSYYITLIFVFIRQGA